MAGFIRNLFAGQGSATARGLNADRYRARKARVEAEKQRAFDAYPESGVYDPVMDAAYNRPGVQRPREVSIPTNFRIPFQPFTPPTPNSTPIPGRAPRPQPTYGPLRRHNDLMASRLSVPTSDISDVPMPAAQISASPAAQVMAPSVDPAAAAAKELAGPPMPAFMPIESANEATGGLRRGEFYASATNAVPGVGGASAGLTRYATNVPAARRVDMAPIAGESQVNREMVQPGSAEDMTPGTAANPINRGLLVRRGPAPTAPLGAVGDAPGQTAEQFAAMRRYMAPETGDPAGIIRDRRTPAQLAQAKAYDDLQALRRSPRETKQERLLRAQGEQAQGIERIRAQGAIDAAAAGRDPQKPVVLTDETYEKGKKTGSRQMLVDPATGQPVGAQTGVDMTAYENYMTSLQDKQGGGIGRFRGSDSDAMTTLDDEWAKATGLPLKDAPHRGGRGLLGEKAPEGSTREELIQQAIRFRPDMTPDKVLTELIKNGYLRA